MKSVNPGLAFAGAVAVLALSGCAAAPSTDIAGAEPLPGFDAAVPLPGFYGIYALEDGTLVRLDGSPAWEQRTWAARKNLPADVRFLVFNRSLAVSAKPLDQLLHLGRVASVRYVHTAAGEVVPHPPGQIWATPDLSAYHLALEFQPVPNHPEMVIAKPESPLPAGLYSLSLDTGQVLDSRFGIDWSEVPQNRYAAQYCVQRYPSGYQPCGVSPPAGARQANAARSPSDFLVKDLHSHRVAGNDGTPELVIQGELVNTSPIPAIMPPLTATLLDADNQVLQALPAVTLPGTPLAPGGAYDFRINVSNPAAGATRVRVTPMA